MKIFKKLFGDDSSRFMNKVKPTVDKINSLEGAFESLSDEALRAKTNEFKALLEKGSSLDDILPEAYAVVREAGKRTMKMRHYDVQMIGGIALHQGNVAEMRTGEGKTLVATLPVYLNALSGKGVHVVTVNDYLARRDTQWMGQLYDFLGLSVSVINSQNTSFLYDGAHVELDSDRDEEGSFKVFEEFLRPISRKEAYEADITYGTNNEFGFDYLRDNTVVDKSQLVQRSHNYVIVDEVDSVLIDEARVPLILSTQADQAEGIYEKFASLSNSFTEDDDYIVDEKLRAVQLTDAGIEKAEKLLNIPNIYTTENIKLVHHLETAVKARAVFKRDKDYVVRDGQVIIVDPFTGRMQEGRRWSDGLHQAVEAKEGVDIKQESKTLASITYQNYFKFYNTLSGMTGTAASSTEEFIKVYGLEVIVIPTNKPIARIDNTDLIFQTEQGKFKAIARKIKEINEKGQPILVGTVSVEKNELLSAYLKQEGVRHEVLNAKNHEAEGMLVAMAGKPGAVTVATNMAGRGVDIKLGGPDATLEEIENVKKLGGLFVMGTERHEARRIDNQLRGRAGRQGDPGETQFFVSLEDSLMRVFGGDRVKNMIGALGIAPDEAIKNKMISNQLENAQKKIEGFNFDARKHVLEFDDVLSHHRNLIYARRRKILFDDENYINSLLKKVLEFDTEKITPLIEEKRTGLDDLIFISLFKRFALHVNDQLWMQHLEVMENTRRSVNLRAYGQREPLVEYKKESMRLFGEMETVFVENLANMMSRIDVGSVKVNVGDEGKDTSDPSLEKENQENKTNEIVKNSDHATVRKGGEIRKVKLKKLDSYLATGWEVVD